MGNYQRNVGNYIGAVDHLTASFGSMGKGAQSIIAPIKGVTMGLKTMSATPVVGILGLLASVLNQIIGSLKTSEENTNAMTAAMAPFAAIGDVVTKILQGLGGVLVKVVEGFGKLTSAIFGSNEATKERLRLAQEEAALQQKERDNIIANAEAEREVARLRAEASDKTNHDAKERIALLEEAGNQERQIAERAMEAARMQYEIVKAKNALTKSSAEDLKKEAEAYAALVNAETNYYKKVREINAGITEARNAEAKAAKDAAKAVRDAATAKINAEKEYLTQLLDIVKEGSESQFKIQNTIAKKVYELAVANAKQKITDQAELNRTLEMLQKAFQVRLQKNQQDHDNKVLAEEVQAATNRAEAFRHGSAEYLEAMRDVAALEYDVLYGKRMAYNGMTYPSMTNMVMGSRPITILNCYVEGQYLYVKGTNFTAYSVVTFNGKSEQETEYLDHSTLRVLLRNPEKEMEKLSSVTVRQISDTNERLSETLPFVTYFPTPHSVLRP